VTQPARLEDLIDENRWLREQLEAKAKVAARALAAQQRRVLEVEEAAAELAQVNERLAAALKILEEKDRRLGEDLAQACAFQQRILPRLPLSEELVACAVYRPAEIVGGDFYDVWGVSGGRVRVFLADCIGHGVQAALRTMILKTEWDRVRDAPTPTRALLELNRRLVAAYPGLELQCTAACFDVRPDAPRGHVAYATAAHPPLVVAPAGGPARQVYQPSPFLGVLDDIELTPVYFDVAPGDRLFLFSDGLVEETRGDEEFGIERVLAALGRRARLDATLEAAVAAVEAFACGAPLTDDLTIVGVEVP
jgi:sigma-B regulation protein RsbU (phosphoserine phosphatase)